MRCYIPFLATSHHRRFCSGFESSCLHFPLVIYLISSSTRSGLTCLPEPSSVVLSLVLFFRAALALVRSIFTTHTHTRSRSRRSFYNMIHVKWGRDILHFPIPPLNTPLGKLRADLAEYTHLPVGSFKLVYKGAVMKEDTAPCTSLSFSLSCGLVLNKAKIVCHWKKYRRINSRKTRRSRSSVGIRSRLKNRVRLHLYLRQPSKRQRRLHRRRRRVRLWRFEPSWGG